MFQPFCRTMHFHGGAENDRHENDGPGQENAGHKLQDMTNISLVMFLQIPVILAVL